MPLTKNFGTISRMGDCRFHWTIENFISLEQREDISYQSPVFNFKNENWHLAVRPKGITMIASNDKIGWFQISFWHSNLSPVHALYVKLGILTGNGEEFKSQEGTMDRDGQFLVSKWITWSELRKNNDEIFPGGCLTVFCELRKRIPRRLPSISGGDKVLHDLERLLLSEEDSDVILKVKDKSFKAHKSILRLRCPVFQSMFKHKMLEEETGSVAIEDCDPSTFPDFLHYIYTGRVEELSNENVFSLFMTADKYCIEELKEQCTEFLEQNVTVDTFCDILTLALLHSKDDLMKSVADYFSCYFKDIILTPKWEEFLSENPTAANEMLIKALVHDKK